MTRMGTSIAVDIDGWMSPSELNWLAEKAGRANIIIEVGCYKGRSTRALADNCPGIVYAVDPWNGPFYMNDGSIEYYVDDQIYQEFCDNLHDCNNVIKMRSRFEDIVNHLPKADFIFIDGPHRYGDVRTHIELGLKLLKKGGIIAGHDYGQSTWPGVKEAVDEKFVTINLNDTIWWIRYGY